MTIKVTINGNANFANNQAATEMPTVANLAYIIVMGDGSLNSLDGTNLATTGSIVNVNTGPQKFANYATFRSSTNTANVMALSTPMQTSNSMTLIMVTRIITGNTFTILLGANNATTNFPAADYLKVGTASYGTGLNGGLGWNSTGTSSIENLTPGQWYFISMQYATGSNGIYYNFTSNNAFLTASKAVAGNQPANNFYIGSFQGMDQTGYEGYSDCAFSMGCNAALGNTTIQKIYNFLKPLMAKRGVAI